MRRFKNKDNINTLLNIDSVFGEYEGHVLPIVLTIVAAAVPIFFWLVLLQGTFIKFWWVLVFDLLWTGRWALILIGKEKTKMQMYTQQREDAYKSADELVHITHIHDNGLIEYDNGQVALLISGFLKGYLTDDKLSVNMESFMNELDVWNWDLFLHNTVDEVLCENDLPRLRRYSDKQVIADRIEFYNYQDEWSRTHTSLYRVTFLVTCAKYAWKRMQSHMEELISSEVALMFNEVAIMDYDGVVDLLNRDICGFVDITNMLLKKYNNDEYYGSKVMWYDDKVPDNLVVPKESPDLDERRQ